MRHPSEHDLALLASGDCGFFRKLVLDRHVSGCGQCQESVASFSELRLAVGRLAVNPEGDEWDRLAAEMKANVRVGLAAGECVRPAAMPAAAFRPRFAAALAGVVLVAGAGLFLKSQLPRENVAVGPRGAVLQVTNSGIEVSSDSGSMTLLKSGDVAAEKTVTSGGAIRASYVAGGQVTVASVYVE